MRTVRALLLSLSWSLYVLAGPTQLDQRDVVVDNVCTEMPECRIECLSAFPVKKEIVPNDCHVIYDTLLFISQSSSPTNTVTGGNNVTMVYNTCKSFFSNTGTDSIEYCRLTWAAKLKSMTSICQSRGAKCAGSDTNWFLEYEHS